MPLDQPAIAYPNDYMLSSKSAHKHMAFCDISLDIGDTESRKRGKNHILIPKESTNAFHSTNLLLFLKLLAPTNSVTHNSLICSYEGPTLETSVLESPFGGQITLSTLLMNQTFVSTLLPVQQLCFLRK